MSAQGDRHVSGQVGGADDVGAEAEGEVARTTGRTFDTVMKAQHAHIRGCGLATRSGEYLRKPTTNIVRVRESKPMCVSETNSTRTVTPTRAR
jgi:hypothetical protein